MSESSIRRARVLLEACPPAEADREKAMAFLRQSFSCYNSFHSVSVPDIQDGDEFQRHRGRVGGREFASWIATLTAKPVSLYKVCTSSTAEEFTDWLAHAASMQVRDLFLVGADTTARRPAAGTLDISTASTMAREVGFHCGGIIIPTRRRQFVSRPASLDETERLLTKVRRDGMKFFSTQILYEGEWMSCLLLDLVRQMENDELPQIFLTLSPFVCADDLNFAKKTLGVYVPRDVDRALRGARSMREASISLLLLLWERLSTFAREIGYPNDKLGVNVEYLDSRNPRNVDAAFELAEEFGRLLKQ